MARTQYAILTPKEGVNPPGNTRRGWAFQYDGNWHEIGSDKPLSLELAEHALTFFTQRPAGVEPVCLVDMEVKEGELALRPVEQPEHHCPVCDDVFTDVRELSNHIAECASKSTEERLAQSSKRGRGKKGEEGAPEGEGEQQNEMLQETRRGAAED